MSAAADRFLPVIRAMAEADIPAVLHIEEAAYGYPWNAAIFRDCLRMAYFCQVHLLDQDVAGYVIMSVGAGEAHILNLCVDPDRHRQGVGRRLLRRALRRAERLGADSMFLEVRPSNKPAVALYRSEGFWRAGRRRDYYPSESGREDALVLRRELSSETAPR